MKKHKNNYVRIISILLILCTLCGTASAADISSITSTPSPIEVSVNNSTASFVLKNNDSEYYKYALEIMNTDDETYLLCDTFEANETAKLTNIKTDTEYPVWLEVYSETDVLFYDGFFVVDTSSVPSVSLTKVKTKTNTEKMSEEEIDAIGAGDQGMMFGYASDETPEYMPYPIALAHKLSRKLTEVRKNGTLPYLRPDGKTQVTVEYDENGVPARLDAVVLSTQHDPEVTQDQIHKDIKKYVFDAIIPEGMVDEKTKFFINPTGRFVIGGPHGDSGLTGRKIIVDTYGGMARHGGGAFSGKDCTKVDRSAAYAARYVAKNIVAAGLAKKCEIQLSYAIGVAHPTSIMVDTFGTGVLEDDKLVEIIRENFDLRPAGIIQMLDLRRPIYKQTAAYGHFGRTDIDLPWEKLDKVEDLKKYL